MNTLLRRTPPTVLKDHLIRSVTAQAPLKPQEICVRCGDCQRLLGFRDPGRVEAEAITDAALYAGLDAAIFTWFAQRTATAMKPGRSRQRLLFGVVDSKHEVG